MDIDAPHREPDAGIWSGISDPGLLRRCSYIGGQWRQARRGATFAVTDPASGQIIAHVADLGAEETDRAIDAASAARAAWQQSSPSYRAKCLLAWYDLIVEASPDLALIMTLEQGKPLPESLSEIDYAASFARWYAEEAGRLNVEGVTSHLEDAQMIVSRAPLGPVALFTPWNFPSAMVTRKAAAALAAGCTVVLHPSSFTPLSALALAELAARADIPPGVFNVVVGRDSAAISERLCADTRIRGVSFTGSTEIGRRIASLCAATVKRLIMELGGNAPLIIFADADLDRALEIAVAAKFATSGQDCLAANRIYVQRPLYEAFCAAFAARVETLRLGPGLSAHVDISPLMHEKAVASTRARVAEARALGARQLTADRIGPGPLFFGPTVLADVPDHAALMREEIFAPVAALAPFDTEEEVVARANATEYGLVAYVVTRDIGLALRMNRALEYGMVAINRVKLTGPPVPFGGVKQSGLGHEGSRLGIEAFTQIKYTCLDLA